MLALSLLVCFTSPAIRRRVPQTLRCLCLDNASFLLTRLTFLTFFWSLAYSRFLTFHKSGTTLHLLVIILRVVLLLFFYTSKLITFYIAFELSILPIFLIILGWGYQSERLSARLRIIFYTLTGSIPLLITLISTQQIFSIISIDNLLSLNSENQRTARAMLIGFFLLAFAVKLPMFGAHLWLPKAHVEAPVLGSIILAAILLKLGSYGLWVFFQIPVPLTIINIWLAISLVGASLVRLLCLRLRDLKIIIAYSSVRHMGILIAALRLNNMSGAKGALILILAHGSTSSAIFLVAYVLYQANHSRSILLTKGVLGWRASLPLLWFLVLISNIATPPSFNLIAELLLILNLTINSGANIPLIIIIVLVGTAYSLILYRSTSQGSMVSFTVSSPLTALSQLRVFSHLWWRFLIILALDLVVV